MPCERRRRRSCHQPNCSNGHQIMERHCLKRRRSGQLPYLITAILTASPAQGRLRPRRLSTSTCRRYQNSPETVPSYLPSFSYNPSQLASNAGLIYECKPFPFNGWCGDYEPGDNTKPWGDAWILVGECLPGDAAIDTLEVDEMEQQNSPASNEAGSSSTASLNQITPEYTVDGLPPCSANPPFSTEEIYLAQDTLYSDGRIYKCKVAPADAWCSLGGYEPGIGMYWDMAWDEVGECFMDEVTAQVGGSSSSGVADDSMSSFSNQADAQACAPLYTSREMYTAQSMISFNNINYECKVPSWCNQESYAPKAGNTMTPVAWNIVGECEGLATAMPSPSPVGSTGVPTDFPTDPFEWIEDGTEVSLEVVEEGMNDALSFVTPEQDGNEEEQVLMRTRKPSPAPIQESVSNLAPCAPLFTQGHEYELKELISFNGHNYQCEVTSQCNDVRYAPRAGQENQGMAWWKVGECHGEATRHPTPRPTPALAAREPTLPNKVDEAHDSYYSSRVPMPILVVLNENKMAMQKKVLISQTPDWDWEYSTLYKFEDLIVALGVMTDHAVVSPFFLGGFGTQSSDESVLYGLVNIAAFLSQAMAESIKFDTCDEANWDFVNNYYPLSNACGQGGLSYQDMTCTKEDAHMACPVKNDMKVTAATSAKWLGGADGAPGPLYCAPKTSDQPYSGIWDHLYNCNRPHEDPPEVCDVYDGQNAGRYDNSFPAGNRASRSDVEGCCWWGRGVIQTRGTCDIGKINHFLGKNAENSPYPNLDFCEDPEALCASSEYKELKWVAGMASWTMRVQSYNENDWGYIPELIKFVDGGMVDNSFIEAITGILVRGCHDDSCGEIEPSHERTKNFKMILDEVFGIGELTVEAGRTFTPTSKPTRRTRKPIEIAPSSKPTRRSRKPTVSPTSSPTIEVSTKMPTSDPTTEIPTDKIEPTLRPTEWRPWYYDYDTQACINDGKQPEWLEQADFFGIKDECCKKKVGANYDICMGRVTYKWSAHNAKVEVSNEKDECPPMTGWSASSDCQSYFMCLNGSRTGPIYDCADDFLFDEEVSECKHKSQVNCCSEGSPMTIKSETFSTSKPTRRPTSRTRPPRPNIERPVPSPYSSTVSQNKKPFASLWFGGSVTAKIKNNDDEEFPQDR